MENDLLTAREVAKYLRVKPQTVKNWAERGILKSIKLGKRGDFRFKRKDIMEMLTAFQIF